MKKIIRFESQGYNVQLQAYEKKLELEGVIARELKARIGIDFKAQDLFPNPEVKLFAMFFRCIYWHLERRRLRAI